MQHLLRAHVTRLELRTFLAHHGHVARGVAQQHAHRGFLFQRLAGEHQACALCHGAAAVDVDEQLFGVCCARQQQGGGAQGDQLLHVRIP
ncbi:hypothetical protein D9M68_934340 [compost metagenome]